MENFKKLIDILKTLEIKNDEQSITGIKELEKYDELIKSIFSDNKITYINFQNACIDDNGIVNEDSERGKVFCSSMIKVKNIEDFKKNVLKENHLYIYSIILNDDESIILRDIQINFKKIKKTFTISEKIYNEFLEISDKLAINKSKFVENKIVEFINKNK